MATFVTNIDSAVNFKVEAEVITIILTAATYKEVICIEVTLKTKGLVINIAAIIYINSL
jgi:hypothetical protein